MSDVHPVSNTEAIFAEKRSDAFSTDVFEKSDQGWSGKDFNPGIALRISSVMFFNGKQDLMFQTGDNGFSHEKILLKNEFFRLSNE